jgi:hypothetical protein
MVLTSGVDSPWMLNASTGILVGAGIGGTSFGIVLPAMARAVGEERRQVRVSARASRNNMIVQLVYGSYLASIRSVSAPIYIIPRRR